MPNSNPYTLQEKIERMFCDSERSELEIERAAAMTKMDILKDMRSKQILDKKDEQEKK